MLNIFLLFFYLSLTFFFHKNCVENQTLFYINKWRILCILTHSILLDSLYLKILYLCSVLVSNSGSDLRLGIIARGEQGQSWLTRAAKTRGKKKRLKSVRARKRCKSDTFYGPSHTILEPTEIWIYILFRQNLFNKFR